MTITGLSGADLNVDWTYLDATGASDGSVTGYSSDSTKTAQTQNGYPPGMLQGVSVDEDGVFTGLQTFHVDSENELRVDAVADLETRLGAVIGGDEQKHAAV